MNACMQVSRAVARAVAAGQGVVALESTLIAHGLPWPENLETARGAEAAVRQAGAVPATIAVLDGQVRVGLADVEIERLARAVAPGSAVRAIHKASRRDLAAVVARAADAATTVAATLALARQAGISVLATGGLGGVHREAATTFDISTDLDELARADGALVVCSGVKSILDIPATLEALETRGVAVVGYGTDTFPAFTIRSSHLPLEWRADTPREVASLVSTHRALSLPGAIVLAQPVPEAVALDRDEMEAALADALEQARQQRITGKAVTPFLLAHLHHATAGRGLAANTALIVANARLAGAVAVALATP